MAHLDRLSSLISHFEIRTRSDAALEDSNLLVLAQGGVMRRLVFSPFGAMDWKRGGDDCIAAHIGVDIGGPENPLLQALPSTIEIDLTTDPDVAALAQMIVAETGSIRCGAHFALNRMCELLVLHLLRHCIAERGAQTGLFAGLADPRLSHALVAMHDTPGRPWRLEDLALLSGMSRSQFIVRFQAVVGTTPIAYLKNWRMVLSRIAILKGGRVNAVARRYGYGSGDAFSRAFTATYGMPPSTARHS